VLLREIAGHPGITVGELARLTGLPKSRVSLDDLLLHQGTAGSHAGPRT